MMPCFAIEIVTPKKVRLNGLWLGPKKAKRVIVWVHGIGSSMFSKLDISEKLTDSKTAVLVFNNRGHDKVSRIAYTNETRIGASELGGGASEVFTECADDIQGAINFAKKNGGKDIYLAGHSTGCQKSIYWASRTRGRGVKGIILLAPISDLSADMYLQGKRKVERAIKAARIMVKQGRKHEFLAPKLWPELVDAQRFLSLHTTDSAEEIFLYSQPKKNPRSFKSVRIPIFAIFAGEDEFADRPAVELAAWFEKHSRSKRFKSVVIPNVYHGFKGAESQVAQEIKKFINA
ncbi:MAG TPA: alpha/beta fold hydrolase [Candidatus Paceibacterota bacterium]